MKGVGIAGVLFLAWQVVGTFFPVVSGGWGGFVFGCLGVFLAYKFPANRQGHRLGMTPKGMQARTGVIDPASAFPALPTI